MPAEKAAALRGAAAGWALAPADRPDEPRVWLVWIGVDPVPPRRGRPWPPDAARPWPEDDRLWPAACVAAMARSASSLPQEPVHTSAWIPIDDGFMADVE